MEGPARGNRRPPASVDGKISPPLEESPEIDLLARAMSRERATLDDQEPEPETLEDKRFALEAAREFIECYISYQREMDGSPDSFRVLDE